MKQTYYMQLARAEILKEKMIDSGQLVINWEFDDIGAGMIRKSKNSGN